MLSSNLSFTGIIARYSQHPNQIDSNSIAKQNKKLNLPYSLACSLGTAVPLVLPAGKSWYRHQTPIT
jgi:hypothetical protein